MWLLRQTDWIIHSKVRKSSYSRIGTVQLMTRTCLSASRAYLVKASLPLDHATAGLSCIEKLYTSLAIIQINSLFLVAFAVFCFLNTEAVFGLLCRVKEIIKIYSRKFLTRSF